MLSHQSTCNFRTAIHDPPIVDVAIVVIQDNQSKTGTNQNGVVSTSSDRISGGCIYPSMTLPGSGCESNLMFIHSSKGLYWSETLYPSNRTTIGWKSRDE